MDDESCHEREIFVLKLGKENALWKAAGRQARADATCCPIRLGLLAFAEQGRMASQPPPEQKGLVGSRDLSLDPVEPISSIRGAQKLTATASQTPPALHCVPCSPGYLGPQSWEERIISSLRVPLTEGKPAELWGMEGGPVPALTLRLLSRFHSPGRFPSKQSPCS